MLGHDLRGPLSTIASCAALEQKRSRSNDSPTAGILLRSVAQMKALLDDLVEYTRNRLGAGLVVDPAPLHLEAFARETLDEIAAVSPGRQLLLAACGDTAGEWDARRLHQALSNLVFNALKYGYPDSAVHVNVDGLRKEQIVLSVENQGKPVPPASTDQDLRSPGAGATPTSAAQTPRWPAPIWASGCMWCVRLPLRTAAPSPSLQTRRARVSSCCCHAPVCAVVVRLSRAR